MEEFKEAGVDGSSGSPLSSEYVPSRRAKAMRQEHGRIPLCTLAPDCAASDHTPNTVRRRETPATATVMHDLQGTREGRGDGRQHEADVGQWASVCGSWMRVCLLNQQKRSGGRADEAVREARCQPGEREARVTSLLHRGDAEKEKVAAFYDPVHSTGRASAVRPRKAAYQPRVMRRVCGPELGRFPGQFLQGRGLGAAKHRRTRPPSLVE